MSDFCSGNSDNCVLLDINLYETKKENNSSPIPSALCDRNIVVNISQACSLEKNDGENDSRKRCIFGNFRHFFAYALSFIA